MPDIRTRSRSTRPPSGPKRPYKPSAKGQPTSGPTSTKQAGSLKAQSKPAVQTTKSLLKRFRKVVRQHPKRLALGAAAVVTALGLCAIPGMPAALALFLVAGAIGFGLFQLYMAYAATPPALAQAAEVIPTSKQASAPKAKSATQTAKTSKLPQPSAPKASHKRRAEPLSKPLAAENQGRSHHGQVLKVKAAARPVEAVLGVPDRSVTESAVSRRCRAMSKLGEWGDIPEIIALGKAFGRNIHIENPTFNQHMKVNNPQGSDVYLKYNGANHYDAIQNGRVLKIIGDGNCLFRAFAIQVETGHAIARSRAVAWLRANEQTDTEGGLTIEKMCETVNSDLRDE
jgi:hypothetical protein